jgi:hypothetical protein
MGQKVSTKKYFRNNNDVALVLHESDKIHTNTIKRVLKLSDDVALIERNFYQICYNKYKHLIFVLNLANDINENLQLNFQKGLKPEGLIHAALITQKSTTEDDIKQYKSKFDHIWCINMTEEIHHYL